MKRCPHCNTELPDTARFCLNCGLPQAAPKKAPVSPLDFTGDLEKQVMDRFFASLRQRVEEEHKPSQFQIYSERLYESGFRDTVHRRAGQLAQKIKEYHRETGARNGKIQQWLDRLYSQLLDSFIIQHCKDINEIPLPEAILQYQEAYWEEVNLFRMILDYLDFAHESEKVYTDFLIMPMAKLKNASKSFLFPDKKEKILLICDQSLFGTCKEGFAFTEKAFYWRAHLEQARSVRYAQLDEIVRDRDWITINGEFFNVNASINLKVMKLLKKIKQLKEEV